MLKTVQLKKSFFKQRRRKFKYELLRDIPLKYLNEEEFRFIVNMLLDGENNA
jgi:hypothetical protein